MRSDDRHCWLMLPQTPAEGLRVLTGRIAKLPEASVLPGGARLQIAMSVRLSSELGEGIPEARLLMGEMLAECG